MSQKKRVFNWFELFECDAMAEYLELMAKKGWMLISLGNVLTFRKMHPTNLKFTVDVMEKSSVFDSLKNKNLLGFRELCEEAGWDFVCTNGIIQVFASNNPNIIPIQTDSEIKAKLISKNVTSKTIPLYLFLLVLCFIQMFFLTDIMNSLWSNLHLITIVSYIYACMLSICQLTASLGWYLKRKRDLSKGDLITYPKLKRVKIRNNILKTTVALYISTVLLLIIKSIKGYNSYLWIFLITLVCYGGMFLLLKCILKLLREKYNFARKINRLVYIFSAVLVGMVMTIAMTLGMFGIIKSGAVNVESKQTTDLVPVVTVNTFCYDDCILGWHNKEESIIASKERYEEWSVVGELSYYMEYEYYICKFAYALNNIRDNQFKRWAEYGYIPYEKIHIAGLIEAELYLQPCAYNEQPLNIYNYDYLIKNKNSLILLTVTNKLEDKELIELVRRME